MIRCQFMFGDIQNSGILNKFVDNFKSDQTAETQQVLQNNNKTVDNLGKQALGFLNNSKDSKIGQLFQTGQPSVKQILFNVVISTLLKSFFKGEVELSNEGASKVLFDQLKNGDKQKKEKPVKEKKMRSKSQTNATQIQQCNCLKNFMPVCGENKKTYGNSCLAKCDGQEYISGLCSQVDSNFFNKTDSNSNQIEQKNKKDKKNNNNKKNKYEQEQSHQQNLNENKEQQQSTQIQQVSVQKIGMFSSSDSCSNCPSIYQPICGVNGKTYKNLCAAECRSVKVQKIGICQLIQIQIIYQNIK